MKFDLGGIDAIESPTADDIRHYLKFMPAESPFVVLSHGDQFIQSIYDGSGYHVEYKSDDGRQFYAATDYETAVKLFMSFLARDGTYRSAVPWKRMRPSARTAMAGLLCVLLIAGLVIAIWSAFN